MADKYQIQELLSIIKSQGEIIAALRVENSFLKARIVELERRLGLDLKASSKPLTSNGLKKQICKPVFLRGSLEKDSTTAPNSYFGFMKGTTKIKEDIVNYSSEADWEIYNG